LWYSDVKQRIIRSGLSDADRLHDEDDDNMVNAVRPDLILTTHLLYRVYF